MKTPNKLIDFGILTKTIETEQCISQLAIALHTTRTTITKHAAKLASKGLLTVERRGTKKTLRRAN